MSKYIKSPCRDPILGTLASIVDMHPDVIYTHAMEMLATVQNKEQSKR